MANETLYSLITSLIPDIWEGALWYAERQFVMPGRVTSFSDRRGFTPRKVSEYTEGGGVTSLAETDDLTPTQFDRALLATLTPAEIGKQIELSDARVETDPENILADAARTLGYEMGRKVEVDLLSNLASVTSGTIGNGTGSFTLNDAFSARALLEANGIYGPYWVVMHTHNWLDIYTNFLDSSKFGEQQIRNQAIREYYLPGIADLGFLVSNQYPRAHVYTLDTGSATGGTFTLSVKVGVGATVTSAAIAEDADAATIETALEAMSNVTAGDVTVTGTDPFTITWNKYDYERTLTSTDSTTGGTGLTTVYASSTSKPAIFTREALALDMRRGLRIEPDRDASFRRSELNATMVYAHGGWRLERGALMYRDATTPS